ncbi:MAG TPA: hypothetical protein VGD40_23175 [Chryseosolibacter sp.]
MLNAISWEKYLISIAVVTAAYYALLLLIFYLHGRKRSIGETAALTAPAQSKNMMGGIAAPGPGEMAGSILTISASDFSIDAHTAEVVDKEPADAVNELCQRLRTLLEVMAAEQFGVDTYSDAIRVLIAQYKASDLDSSRKYINRFINECLAGSQVSFSAADFNRIWNNDYK